MQTKIKVIETGSKGNAYLLYHNGDVILLDAGVSFKEIKKAMNYNLFDLRFGVVTHRHTDHMKSMKEMLDSGIVIISSDDVYRTVYMDDWEYMAWVQRVYDTRDWIVKSWEVDHDVPNQAYILYNRKTERKIAYITDTSHVTKLPATVDTLICEVSYCDEVIDAKQNDLAERYLRLKRYHMSLARFKEMLLSMKQTDGYCLRHLVIVHLSNENSNAKQIREEVAEIIGFDPVLAENGMEIEVE